MPSPPAPLPRCGRGEPRADMVGVLKRQLQRGRKLRFRTPQSPSPASRERGTKGVLIRVHRLSSLCAGRARFFALTPSPSPTAWERGVGAHGSAPCSAFPLSRRAGEGDTGGEGNTARLPVHACAGKIAPASAILCRTDVPLPAKGVRAKRRACLLTHPLGKNRACPQAPCRTDVPLSDLQEEGVVFTHILRTLAAQLV